MGKWLKMTGAVLVSALAWAWIASANGEQYPQKEYKHKSVPSQIVIDNQSQEDPRYLPNAKDRSWMLEEGLWYDANKKISDSIIKAREDIAKITKDIPVEEAARDTRRLLWKVVLDGGSLNDCNTSMSPLTPWECDTVFQNLNYPNVELKVNWETIYTPPVKYNAPEKTFSDNVSNIAKNTKEWLGGMVTDFTDWLRNRLNKIFK